MACLSLRTRVSHPTTVIPSVNAPPPGFGALLLPPTWLFRTATLAGACTLRQDAPYPLQPHPYSLLHV